MKQKSEGRKTPAKPQNLPEVTVRECLTWHPHEEKGKKQAKERRPASRANGDGPQTTSYLPKKGILGKPIDRGYVMPDHAQPRDPEDEGTVIEALRGWPNHRGGRGRNQDENPDGAANGDTGSMYGADDKDLYDDKGEYMGPLISHYYLQQALLKRQKEEAKREAAEKEAKRRRNPGAADIKGNRTAQLRSIALAEKVDKDAKNLWQLPKFKNNARAHITTKRQKEENKGKNGQGEEKYQPGEDSGYDPDYSGYYCGGYGDTDRSPGNGERHVAYNDDLGYNFGETDYGRSDKLFSPY